MALKNGHTTVSTELIVQGSVHPSGAVVAYAGAVAPAGWLLCDGTTVSRATYSTLFANIGVAHGSGDGSTTFRLPDYRGRFLRGVDGSASLDPNKATRTAMAAGGNTGNNVGSVQGSATAAPTTSFTTNTTGAHTHTMMRSNSGGGGGVSIGDNSALGQSATSTSSAGDHSHTITGGDAESRPKNAYVNYIIKV